MGARTLLAALFMALCASGRAQDEDAVWLDSLETYWARINATYLDSARTPLPMEHRADFTALERFAPDPRYRMMARFEAREGEDFGMPTTTDRVPVYRSVGTLHFELDGEKLRLTVYQNRDLIARKPEYANHLFVPFTDLTNGEGTYGGGRYLDFEGPLGRDVELDFNRAYNPYCAYGGNYSCPIPPMENHLRVPVPAGVKDFRH